MSTEKPDHGEDLGQAHLSRPSKIQNVGAISRGSVAPGEKIEVKRMQDSILIDRMWHAAQLTDRQHKAASTLYAIWTRAGLNPQMVQRPQYRNSEIACDDEPQLSYGSYNPLELIDDETYLDLHRRLMRGLPAQSAGILDALMLDRHPGCWHLAAAQAALDALADSWGYERGGSPQLWHIFP